MSGHAGVRRVRERARSHIIPCRSPRGASLSSAPGVVSIPSSRPGTGRRSSSVTPRPRSRGTPRPSADEVDKNFKVVVRVRPPLPRELDQAGHYQRVVEVQDDNKQIVISENMADQEEQELFLYTTHRFTFDYVYDEDSQQQFVYDTTAKAAVHNVLEGYNATVFAYGQTGTGKTFTMEGFDNSQQRGIIPRAVESVFDFIQTRASANCRFLVRASYLQIYNEVISDLLKPERTNLAIREDKRRGVFVEGLSEWVVRSPHQVYGLIQRGTAIRATGSTRMNAVSSRSHALFLIIVEQEQVIQGPTGPTTESQRKVFKVGKLNLVDLAGSERVRLSGATGQRLEESKKINQSLSALGNVIAALTDPVGRSHIPYRDSKLTRILEDSLGGNCKTTMMATISPAMDAFLESLSTLKFANRAKNIKNKAHINEDLDEKALLRRYEQELKKLRQELRERNRNVVDKRKLIEVEEDRRRAEQDKMAALMNLERLSRDLMSEKSQKKRLETRIKEMTSQLLTGGSTVEDTVEFKRALAEEQRRIRREYQQKMVDLEKEREAMEEEKVQTDRYKQLLLKQRDIMIQLTARLNERDQSILALTDELERYDRQQCLMEDELDQKTASIIQLQKMAAAAAAAEEQHSMGDTHDSVGAATPSTHMQGQGSRGELQALVQSLEERAQQVQELEQQNDELCQRVRHMEQIQTQQPSVEELVAQRVQQQLSQYQQDSREHLRRAEETERQLLALKRQYDEQAKERSALQVIMEHKLKTLVDSVVQTLSLESMAGDGSAEVPPRTVREIIVLQRLIDASVMAMQQSATGPSPPDTASNSARAGQEFRATQSATPNHDHNIAFSHTKRVNESEGTWEGVPR